MRRILTTGPVENAAGNPSVSLWVKVLNNDELRPVKADISVYTLNGAKNLLGSAVRQIAPLSSDYEIFDITNVLEYEAQISLDREEMVFVSVWGKDANADLVAAHRFVPAELSPLEITSSSRSKKKSRQMNRSNR